MPNAEILSVIFSYCRFMESERWWYSTTV